MTAIRSALILGEAEAWSIAAAILRRNLDQGELECLALVARTEAGMPIPSLMRETVVDEARW